MNEGPAPAPTPNPLHARQALEAALKADPDYAWAWHCNLAMPIMDDLKVSREHANWAAARLMRHCFDIDITRHANWDLGNVPPPQNPKAERREEIAVDIAARKEAEIIRERIEESLKNELHSTPEADTPESLGRRLVYLEGEIGEIRDRINRVLREAGKAWLCI
jgi:hypothetical protein